LKEEIFRRGFSFFQVNWNSYPIGLEKRKNDEKLLRVLSRNYVFPNSLPKGFKAGHNQAGGFVQRGYGIKFLRTISENI